MKKSWDGETNILVDVFWVFFIIINNFFMVLSQKDSMELIK